MSTLLSILDEIRADPESYRHSFVLARQKVLEQLLVASTDSSSVIGQLTAVARFDIDESYFERLPAKVASLTLADFHAFVAKELPTSRQVFGAFGNQAAAMAAIGAAKQHKPAQAKPAVPKSDPSKPAGGIADPFSK